MSRRLVELEQCDDSVEEVEGALVRRAFAATAAAVLSLSMAAGPSHASLFGAPEEKDPIEPFSVFGSVYKKYVVDILDETGRKIVGRKKGFTAEACIDVISASQQKFRVPGEGGSLAPGGPTSAAVAQAGAATGSFASTSTPVARLRVCEERVVKVGGARVKHNLHAINHDASRVPRHAHHRLQSVPPPTRRLTRLICPPKHCRGTRAGLPPLGRGKTGGPGRGGGNEEKGVKKNNNPRSPPHLARS